MLAGLAFRSEGVVRKVVDATVLPVVAWQYGRRPLAAAPRCILVLRNNDLGDVLVITPLFEALRRRFPHIHLAAAVGSWAVQCLQNNPHLSEVIITDAPWFNTKVEGRGAWAALRWIVRSPVIAHLRECGFDVGIDVLGSTWGALLLLAAGIPERLGTSGYAGGRRGFSRSVPYDPSLHVGRGALRFAELLGAESLPESRPQLFLTHDEIAGGEAIWRGAFGPHREGRVRVLIGPAAGVASRAWPPGSFAELLAKLRATGGLDLAISVGGGERALGERLASASGARLFDAGLGLRQVFSVVAVADLVLCNSSMLMHAAAAFRRPTVVLLGASFPSARAHHAQWGYPGTCWSLGRESGEREEIAAADEVTAFLRQIRFGTATGAV
jgi:ADP-heptose:LPS heptosyltransferase